MHCCPEIQIYTCFVFNENGKGKHQEVPGLIGFNMTVARPGAVRGSPSEVSSLPVCSPDFFWWREPSDLFIFYNQYPRFLGICHSTVRLWPEMSTAHSRVDGDLLANRDKALALCSPKRSCGAEEELAD